MNILEMQKLDQSKTPLIATRDKMRLRSYFVLIFICAANALAADEIIRLPNEPIFPGQAPAIVSETILEARDLTISRKYAEAERLLWKLVKKLPDDPSGSAGLMVLYEIRMLENEEPFLDAEMRRAIEINRKAIEKYKKSAPENSWYYTLIGASLGIEGIYFLWQNHFMDAGIRGYAAIQSMQKAREIDSQNWEARLGLGVYSYYRSVYSAKVPFLADAADSAEKGIAEVKLARQNRVYLDETARIALCRIYFDAKKYDAAEKLADGLIEDYPKFPAFYLFAARGLFEEGRYVDALPYYEKVYDIDPTLSFAPYRAGVCLEKTGRKNEAADWYRKAVAGAKNRKSDKWSGIAKNRIEALK